MAPLAHQFARLIGPFHGFDLRCARDFKGLIWGRLGPAAPAARLARLIREGACLVNVTSLRFDYAFPVVLAAISDVFRDTLPGRQDYRTRL
jgi:hypothetical protein